MKRALLALVVLAPALMGCIQLDPDGRITVHVLVTEDLGRTVRTDERPTLDAGASAIDALRAVATVETAYGGGFVESVDGRSSQFPNERVDWFLDVNGVHSPVGGAEVTLHDDDLVIWDYRPWDRTTRLAGLMTAWPRPFTVSSDGQGGHTEVLVDAGLDAPGERTRTWLVAEGLELDNGTTRHTVLVTLDRPADALGPHDPALKFVRVDDDRLVLTDGPTLDPPWGLVVRGLPDTGEASGDGFLILSGSSADGLDLLLDALEAGWPKAGIGLAVNATVTTVVPA